MLALPAQILADALAPPLARWSESREREILRHGEPLPRGLLDLARGLGIHDPAGLRLEIRPRIPLPVADPLLHIARAFRLPVFHPAGMCLGRGLSCTSPDPGIIYHELVHTLQYQRLESHKAFMWQYVFECLHHGYTEAPLEIEARERSHPSP